MKQEEFEHGSVPVIRSGGSGQPFGPIRSPVSLSGGNIGQRLRRSCNTPKRRAEVRQIDHGEQDPATQNTC
jgi:hypothetical protein